MYYGYHSFWIWGFIVDGLWHILLIALVVWVILWLFRGHRGGRWNRMNGMRHSHSALTILNERYAKGEINKEEYEERKKVLMNQQ